MRIEELFVEKENLMIRFSRLTDEAIRKLQNNEEEDLPLILDKRQKLIERMEIIKKELSALDYDKNSVRFSELKAKILEDNKGLQEMMEDRFISIKENMGNNKNAIKVSKAYGEKFNSSYYVNKKN